MLSTSGPSQSRHATDSGYSSNYTPSPNRSYPRGLSPIQQPVFPSPQKPSKRNDVWVHKTSPRLSTSYTVNEKAGPNVSTPKPSVSPRATDILKALEPVVSNTDIPSTQQPHYSKPATCETPPPNPLLSVPADNPSSPVEDTDNTPKFNPTNNKFYPTNNKFYPIPEELVLTEEGYLDSDTEAEFMNLTGSCRLCGESVSSYLASMHILECSKLDLDPRHEFVIETSEKLFSVPEIILPIIWSYLEFNYMDAKVPNDTFTTVEQYHEFTRGVDELVDKLSAQFFEIAELSKSHYINILKYQ
jgi:hypothetical protein